MVAKDDPRMEAGWASVDVGSEAFYSQGGETAKIPRSMHKENRARVLQLMAGDALEGGIATACVLPNPSAAAGQAWVPTLLKVQRGTGSVIFVKGGEQQCRDDTDHEEIFRQESNFHYLFGVAEAGCFGTVSVPDGKATLFVPRLPDSYAVWMGTLLHVCFPAAFCRALLAGLPGILPELTECVHRRRKDCDAGDVQA